MSSRDGYQAALCPHDSHQTPLAACAYPFGAIPTYAICPTCHAEWLVTLRPDGALVIERHPLPKAVPPLER